MALGICEAYKIISTDALLVNAGVIPICKMVSERAKLFEKKELTPLEERQSSIAEWAKEWSEIGKRYLNERADYRLKKMDK